MSMLKTAIKQMFPIFDIIKMENIDLSFTRGLNSEIFEFLTLKLVIKILPSIFIQSIVFLHIVYIKLKY